MGIGLAEPRSKFDWKSYHFALITFGKLWIHLSPQCQLNRQTNVPISHYKGHRSSALNNSLGIVHFLLHHKLDVVYHLERTGRGTSSYGDGKSQFIHSINISEMIMYIKSNVSNADNKGNLMKIISCH